MSDQKFTLQNITNELISSLPEARGHIADVFPEDYDLATDPPGPYLVLEDVVLEWLFRLLDTAQNPQVLIQLFSFLGKMAASPDPDISRDLLGIAIIEPLVCTDGRLKQAWQYLGPKVRDMARSEAESRNLQGRVPQP